MTRTIESLLKIKGLEQDIRNLEDYSSKEELALNTANILDRYKLSRSEYLRVFHAVNYGVLPLSGSLGYEGEDLAVLRKRLDGRVYHNSISQPQQVQMQQSQASGKKFYNQAGAYDSDESHFG